MKLNGNYSGAISKLLKTEIETVSFKKYPIAILQFNYDRDFAHVNFVCKETSFSSSNTLKGKVTELEEKTSLFKMLQTSCILFLLEEKFYGQRSLRIQY